MRKILNVAEKASAAKEAALFLANGQQKLVSIQHKSLPLITYFHRSKACQNIILFINLNIG